MPTYLKIHIENVIYMLDAYDGIFEMLLNEVACFSMMPIILFY